MPKAVVKFFHETDSHTAQYVVSCDATNKCAIIDPVAKFDVSTGTVSFDHLDEIHKYISDNSLQVCWILETHAHADHISAGAKLKEYYPGAKQGIGAHITDVQKIMKEAFNLDDNVAIDGSQFDVLFSEGDILEIGELKGTILHTPGHTPACISYYFTDDCIFVGDTIFMPDQGTARCDFPGGASTTLWQSIHKILALPSTTRLFTCHDYAPGGRDYQFESTIGDQVQANKHVKQGTTEQEFTKWRKERDDTLSLPRLIIPSIQCNINAGAVPAPEGNGISYLKIPVNKASMFKST